MLIVHGFSARSYLRKSLYMGLRQACNFNPCTEFGWRQLVGVGRIEIGMNSYPLNMKAP